MNSGDVLFNEFYGYGILTLFADGTCLIQYSGDTFAGYVTNLDGWQKVSFMAIGVPDSLADEAAAAVQAVVNKHRSVEPPKGTRIKISENEEEYHIYFRANDTWIDEDGNTYTWRDLKNLAWKEV